MIIRELNKRIDRETSVLVIRDSFVTVAEEFNITKENCPTHPSFVSIDNIEDLVARGISLFGLFNDEMQIGFVALEKGTNDLYYLEKLAVLPAFRRQGYGRQLVDFIVGKVTAQRGKKVSIGIIDESKKLKAWYRDCGFRETGTKTFSHLPFTVCFMERIVD
jgi:ribosomal protein S18 acetylase RimI-like enzyme